MKIYCVLFDTMPFRPDLIEICRNKSLDFHHQISNCYTTTSVLSFLSGLLPSQIIPSGVGYHTPEKLINEGSLWNEHIIFDQLNHDLWDISIHNAVWIENNIFNKFKLRMTTSLDGGIENEKSGVWASEGVEYALCSESEMSNRMHQRELDHIKKIQSTKASKHQFHFIIYHHYHAAVVRMIDDSSYTRKLVLELINSWNFDEEDALFWFFADHGNFRMIDKFCTPPHACNTWAMTRDNIKGRKSRKRLISILDFIPSISETLSIKVPVGSIGESIYSENNLDRTFFFEDSRSEFDLFNSTMAGAVSCKKWNSDGYPKLTEQTSLFIPSHEISSCNFDYEAWSTVGGDEEKKDEHIFKLKKQFKWVK